MTVVDIQGEIDQLAGQGGGVYLIPPGTLQTPTGGQIVVPDKVSIVSLGTGYGAVIPTVVEFDPALIATQPYEACIVLNGRGSTLAGFAVAGPSLSDPVPVAVRLRGHAAVCRQMSTHFVSKYGFHVEAGTADQSNANNFELDHCRSARAGLAGFYVNGEESNAGTIIACIADGNSGYGFFESSFLGNAYIANHASNNPLGNYAQGGTILTPTVGGLSNYSAYLANYAEGQVPNCFRSNDIDVSFGNLPLTVAGWPDVNGNQTPFPGTTGGFRARLNFWRGGLLSAALRESISGALPYRAGVRHAAFSHKYTREAQVEDENGKLVWQTAADSDVETHHAFERYASANPSWLANTRCLDRLGSSWWTPYAWSDERHAKGAGRGLRAMPKLNSPFDFTLHVDLIVGPYSAVVARFDSDFLREQAGGYLGTLVLHAPGLTRAFGSSALTFAHDDWERIDENTVQTVVENNSAVTSSVRVVLVGERVQY